ncbi:thioredoxin family protein [Sulfuracidifex tepidarius]|uniref:Thioredoxin n=1 Tax=Sulfuracidifex tepidarius TaxID=1294262 RepID=A0A510E183_9CREN|nr:thioredoxin family protein [Sulfuracidifex tepidarius]BBG23501.1 Thioredoxin [Sulfuracidifex tepidarius]BBG26254.1 Thioredoxin [Sulfuracidifex tepidarius]
MSYDPIVEQYLKAIKPNLSLTHCKAGDVLEPLNSVAEIKETEECDKPFIKVKRKDEDREIFTYMGVPMINEFWPFLNALVRTSNGLIHLEEKEREIASNLAGDVKLFVTPDCTKCPVAAELLYQVAIMNDKVKLEVIDSSVYDELAKKFRVMSVPKVVVNDKAEVPGGFPPDILLKMILKATQGQ